MEKATHVFLCMCQGYVMNTEWAPSWRVFLSVVCSPWADPTGSKEGGKTFGNVCNTEQLLQYPWAQPPSVCTDKISFTVAGMDTKDTLHGLGPTQRSCQNNPMDAAAPVLLPRAQQLLSASPAPNPGISAQVLFGSHFPCFYTGILLVSALRICSKDLDGAKDDPTCTQWHSCAPSLPWHESPLAAILLSQQSKEMEFSGKPDQIIHWALSRSEIMRVWKEAGAALIFWVFQLFHNFSCFGCFWCIFLYHFVVSWLLNLSRYYIKLLLQYKTIEIFIYMSKRVLKLV